MKMPFPLKDAVLQRLFEEVYKKITKGDKERQQMLADMNAQMAALRKRVADSDTDTKETGYVLPIPLNLTTVKMGPFGIAAVDPFKVSMYPGLWGYEFYGSDTTGFVPNDDRSSEGYNLKHRGVSPWCFYWCGIQTESYYIRARTYGAKGNVSPFTEEASTDDVADVPQNVTLTQIGSVYYMLGRPYVTLEVAWDEVDDPLAISYDIKLVDEGRYN